MKEYKSVGNYVVRNETKVVAAFKHAEDARIIAQMLNQNLLTDKHVKQSEKYKNLVIHK